MFILGVTEAASQETIWYRVPMASPRRIAPDAKLEAVLLAAEALFSQQGYSSATMAAIADRAGVAVGTIYRFFPDKPALLRALHLRVADRMIAAMEQGWQSEPDYAHRFPPTIRALFKAAARDGELLTVLQTARDAAPEQSGLAIDRMVAAIAQMYLQGLHAGAYRAFAPIFAAQIAYGMVEGAMRVLMAPEADLPPAELESQLATAMTTLFVRGDTR